MLKKILSYNSTSMLELTEKVVDLAAKRILGSRKDTLKKLYDSPRIPDELRKIVMNYVGGDADKKSTFYSLKALKKNILENNGHNGRIGEDDLEPWVYVY